VRFLTNASGHVTDSYDYDAFGNLLNHTGDTVNNYLYCGEQFDSTTGLYYLRARYMNPSTGTFISQDAYQGSVYDPVSLHKYLYANANPVMYSDPSGYKTSLGEMVTAFAIQAELAICEAMANHSAMMIFNGLIGGVISAVDAGLGGASVDEIILRFCEGFFAGVIFSFAQILFPALMFEIIQPTLILIGIWSTGVAIEEGNYKQAFLRGILSSAGAAGWVNSFMAQYAGITSSWFSPPSSSGNTNPQTPSQSNGSSSYNYNDLPSNPNDLVNQGWTETTHPQVAANSNTRTFVNELTGQTVNFDTAVPGKPGFGGIDHYHIINPNGTGNYNYYLDINGNPVPKGSNPSHIIP
jgi:RHS repeat-associated protein